MLCFLKKSRWWTKSQKKNVSFNFSHTLFSLVPFLTFEDGGERLSQNISKELPLYATEYPTRADLTWWFGDKGLGLHQHGSVQSDPVWHGPVWHSSTNLKLPHIFKHQISGRTLILHSSKWSSWLHFIVSLHLSGLFQFSEWLLLQ